MNKRALSIAIAFLILLAFISSAGCTVNLNTNTASSSRDATLSQLVSSQSAYLNNSSSQATPITGFQVTWLNDTAVKVDVTGTNSTNQTQTISELFLAFKTTADATQYVQSIKGSTPPDYTNYSLIGSSLRQLIPYEQVTGHAPTVFAAYFANSANDTAVYQCDNVVVIINQVG